MSNSLHDILMITYNRPEFTRRALGQLLETCDERMRVWIWHNGTHDETLSVVKGFQSHPSVYHVQFSEENKKLREPTNWFWENADGAYLSKVDDDCLLPHGWAEKLRSAHDDNPSLGIIGCWRFYEHDFVPELAEKKIRPLQGGHRIMRHVHVQGSGYVMKRKVYSDQGPIRRSESFTHYCNRAAAMGWQNGWYFPFIHEEHMDDARSAYYPYATNEAFMANRPLSAVNFGVRSLEEWKARSAWLARRLQEDRSEGKSWVGWRRLVRRASRHLSRALGYREPWRQS
jgi:GT2 family glycosyltransferase